ncbi:hypothetical protein [Metabacillus fastidiosus]|uniref:hypothetical protein n=1 Tax=Metabacillus fastidiosus TaxID=1458 RepID=UPI003D2A7E97
MIIEDKHYYNNSYLIINDILEFERVYMVDENKFNNNTYEALGKMYENLPSYIDNPTFLPCWFGDEEKGEEYFISVSFEMSGLQFWGRVPLSDFCIGSIN